MDKETYLGDGLYVSFDGYQFCFRAPREIGDHEVYIEPRVFKQFLNYASEALGVHISVTLFKDK
jgi:hypothetical protein